MVNNLGEGPNYSSNSEDCLLINFGEGPNYSSNSEDCLLIINLGEGPNYSSNSEDCLLLLLIIIILFLRNFSRPISLTVFPLSK